MLSDGCWSLRAHQRTASPAELTEDRDPQAPCGKTKRRKCNSREDCGRGREKGR